MWGAPPKGAGKVWPSSSVSTQPRGSEALRNPGKGGELGEEEGKTIGDWSFLSYLKNRNEMTCEH